VLRKHFCSISRPNIQLADAQSIGGCCKVNVGFVALRLSSSSPVDAAP